MRYMIIIQYDGSRYEGWQRQTRTDNTIQGKIEAVLTRFCGVPVEVSGAGRTDAGAHALGQVASFDLPGDAAPEQVLAALNQYLPEDIAVSACEAAPPRFHARLNAKGKLYRYEILLDDVGDVFRRKYQYRVREPLDLSAMKKAVPLLLGTHDFMSFCSNKHYTKSTVRTLQSISLTREGNVLRLDFTGDGFLYNMVRILTGTLIEIGLHQREADTLPDVFAARCRERAGFTAPAQGLTLVRVFYDALPVIPLDGAKRA